MIELKRDALEFSFPEVHLDAVLRIEFQRTLRIPDDDRDYWLPPGLGRFPVRHVDDYAAGVPERWRVHGGVMLPMYQAEAMWLNFTSPSGYPFAVKVGTGKRNAVTGEAWREGLHREPQDYLSVPRQPWLDGFCVEEGVVRQFVAMPLGAGYSAEEQLTGSAEHGGLQLTVFPLRASVWRRILAERPVFAERSIAEGVVACSAPDMGLAPGGRMQQQIYGDPYGPGDWETSVKSRCFVHLANSMLWRAITGEEPPTVPPTAEEYTRAGLPWFAWYDEQPALRGSPGLGQLESVSKIGQRKGEVPLPENTSVDTPHVVRLRGGARLVREGQF